MIRLPFNPIASLKWLAILLPMAAVVGSASAFFLWALDALTRHRFDHPWLLYFLPLAGVAVGALYHHFGGKSGAVGKFEIHNREKPADVAQHHAKFSGLRVEPGDVVSYFSPSGGGYGDPLDRDPQLVLDDVLDDFISAEHAHEVYGVVLSASDDGYAWALDREATERRRASLRG